MPRVPQFKPRSRISTDVAAAPTPSVSQVGIVERAEQRLAKGIGEFALELGKRRALARRNHEKNKFENEVNQFISKNEEESKKDREGIIWDGYRDFNEKNLKDFIDSKANEAPTQQIANDIRNMGTTLLNRKRDEWNSTENLETQKFISFSDAKNREDSVAQIRNDRNMSFFDVADTMMKRRNQRQEGMGITHTLKTDAAERAKEHEYAEAQLDKLLENPDSYDKAERFLERKDLSTSEDELYKALGSDRVTIYKNRLKKARKSLQTEFENKLTDDLNLYKKAKNSGAPLGFLRAEGQNIMRRAEMLPPGAKKDAKILDIVDTEFSASLNKEKLAVEPIEDIQGMGQDLKYIQEWSVLSPFGKKVAASVLAKNYKDAVTQMEKEIDKDALKYFEDNIDSFKNLAVLSSEGNPEAYRAYARMRKQLYDNKKISKNLRNGAGPYFKKVFGDGIRNAINAKDHDTAIGLFESIDQMAGEDANMIRREIGLPASYEVVGDVDPSQRAHALQLLTSKDLKTSFENRGGSTSTDDIENVMVELRQNPIYRAASIQGGSSPDARANADAMIEMAYRNYQNLVAEGANEEAAKAGAWQIFSNKNVLDADHYSVEIPQNSNSEKVIKYMDHFTSDRAPSDVFSPTKELNIDTRGQSEEAMNLAIRATAVWVNSPNKNGAELWARTQTGILQPVRDKEGGVVTRTFSEMEEVSSRLPETKSQSQLVSEIMKERIERRRRLNKERGNL